MVGQFVVQLNGLQMETSELPSCSSDLLFLNSCVLNLETQTGSGVIQQSEGGHDFRVAVVLHWRTLLQALLLWVIVRMMMIGCPSSVS